MPRFSWFKPVFYTCFWAVLLAGCGVGPPWVTVSQLPTGRLDMTTTVLNGKIYTLGGFEGDSDNRKGSVKVEVYNPLTNAWETMADMPSGRGGMASAVIGTKIYTLGGSSGSAYPPVSTAEVFDTQTNSWSKLPDLLEAVDGATANQVDGKLFVIGGARYNDLTQERISIATVEEFDPQAQTWVKKTDMPTPRYAASSCVLNGQIYVVGGLISTFQMVTPALATQALEVYDPQTDTWTQKADIPAARAEAALAIINEKIYIFGGIDNDYGSAISTIFVYDPAKDTWSTLPDMPFDRLGFSVSVVNGKAYFIGGSEHSFPLDSPESDVWEYKP